MGHGPPATEAPASMATPELLDITESPDDRRGADSPAEAPARRAGRRPPLRLSPRSPGSDLPAPRPPGGTGPARPPPRRTFADDVAVQGTYAALTRALALRLSTAPELPSGAGEVLFVVGPGVETLRAARSLAASLRLDPDSVQWATRGELRASPPRAAA